MRDVIYSIFAIIAFLVFMGFLFWCGCNAANVNIYDYEAIYGYEELLEPCEHEFVITSQYNWFLKAYKTVSKCIKCGKVI